MNEKTVSRALDVVERDAPAGETAGALCVRAERSAATDVGAGALLQHTHGSYLPSYMKMNLLYHLQGHLRKT